MNGWPFNWGALALFYGGVPFYQSGGVPFYYFPGINADGLIGGDRCIWTEPGIFACGR